MGYYARRSGLTFVYLVVALLAWLVVVGASIGLASGFHGTGRVVAVSLVAVCVVWSFGQAVRASALRRRARATGTHGGSSGSNVRRRVGAGSGLGTGVAAYGGSVVGGAFLVVGSFFVVGTVTMWVVDSLGRYLNNEEFFAAEVAARWRAEHPGGPS